MQAAAKAIEEAAVAAWPPEELMTAKTRRSVSGNVAFLVTSLKVMYPSLGKQPCGPGVPGGASSLGPTGSTFRTTYEIS